MAITYLVKIVTLSKFVYQGPVNVRKYFAQVSDYQRFLQGSGASLNENCDEETHAGLYKEK